MKYTAIPMSDRMRQVKRTCLSMPVPNIVNSYRPDKYRCNRSGDRLMTLGYLHGFEQHADAPTTLLRTSYAEAQELYESIPQILDDELLLGHLYIPELSDEQQREYDRLCDSYIMSAHTLKERAPRKDHICLDFDKLLRVGINGLRDEIRQRLDSLSFSSAGMYPDMDCLRQHEFYQCCLIELDAVSDLAARYADAAIAMAQEKPEPRRSELVRLGQILRKVPDNPASDFYEAVQSVHFFLSTLFGLYPLGRPDRYLYPYYRNDIENGTLSREFAQELVDNFCLGVSDRVFSRAACGFIVGGRDEEGSLVENDLTYMFLTALDHLKLPDPNGALAVCRDTGDELLSYCAEILSHGTSHPAFYNDEAITDSLIRHYGVDPRDAVNYIHSTCAEITVIGKSKGHTTPFLLDLPRVLMDTAKDGIYESMDALYDAMIRRLGEKLRTYSFNYAVRILEAARIGNDAMRSCTLIDDCIAKGRSIYEGGERYTFVQPIRAASRILTA